MIATDHSLDICNSRAVSPTSFYYLASHLIRNLLAGSNHSVCCSKRQSHSSIVGGAVLELPSANIRLWNLWRWPFHKNCILESFQHSVVYAADYRTPYVPQVELLTRKLYEHGTCTSWKIILYPSKWCLFQWAAIYSHWAVCYTIEVSFDQSSTTRTYYRLCIW